MTIEDLLQWGYQHNYPLLVLSSRKDDVLQHGEPAWKRLAEGEDMAKIERAMSRVEQWHAVEQKAGSRV